MPWEQRGRAMKCLKLGGCELPGKQNLLEILFLARTNINSLLPKSTFLP